MAILKLNQISKDIFRATGVADGVVKLNSATNISRKDIIATGRLVACEYVGAYINANPNAVEKYNSHLEKVSYSDLERKHREKKLLYCAAMACKETGEEAPATWDEFERKNIRFARNSTFLKVLAAIDREVLEPLFFNILDGTAMQLLRFERIPFGGTKEITIRSNDVFLFEDSAWGSTRSVSKNYLYAKTITLQPKVVAANATIKWYQDIVAGDAGRYYAALINRYYNKIYAKLIAVLNKAVAEATYIPAGLQAETYDTESWITITDKLAAAAGVDVSDLMAIGTRSALSKLLPVDGSGGALTGLQYGLGKEWFENGYLPNAGGISLFPVTPVVVPTTQNSTIQTIDTGANIYILPRAGRGYAPIMGGYYEGTPIDLVATPNAGDALGTADATIDINMTATLDMQPVFASKVAVVKSVYGS